MDPLFGPFVTALVLLASDRPGSRGFEGLCEVDSFKAEKRRVDCERRQAATSKRIADCKARTAELRAEAAALAQDSARIKAECKRLEAENLASFEALMTRLKNQP